MQKDFMGNFINEGDLVVKAGRTSTRAYLEEREVAKVSERGVQLLTQSGKVGPFVKNNLILVVKGRRTG